MQLKASGVVPGVPDIIFLWNGKAYGFEFKTITGVLSPAQSKIHSIWQGQNVPVYVIRDDETFIAHIRGIIQNRSLPAGVLKKNILEM